MMVSLIPPGIFPLLKNSFTAVVISSLKIPNDIDQIWPENHPYTGLLKVQFERGHYNLFIRIYCA
jgi:hypothetical protein